VTLGKSIRSLGGTQLHYLLLLLLLASCAVTREISPPYKPRAEALVTQLTDQPYSLHIVENLPVIARVDMRTRWIEVNGRWAEVLMTKDPRLLRAILAHEIAHDKLGHRRVPADDRHALQQLELEADEEAVKILHSRGYNPQDYLRAMRMFKAIEDKNPAGSGEQYYSTHPYAGERLERIEKMIEALGPVPKIPVE